MPAHLPSHPVQHSNWGVCPAHCLQQSALLQFTLAPGMRGLCASVMEELRRLGRTQLFFFLFMELTIPVTACQREIKECGTPALLGAVGVLRDVQLRTCCRATPSQGWCLPACSLLVLYTVDVEQHFSLCFSRPDPLLFFTDFALVPLPLPFKQCVDRFFFFFFCEIKTFISPLLV